MYKLFKTISFVLLISLTLSSSIGQQKSLAVTIYNNDFAMIKDVRSINFDKGQSYLYFNDVSANIETPTVTFKALKNPQTIRVYQQNFERNLVTKEAILKKYIQKEITIYVELGPTSKRVKGKLLGYDNGYILQTQTGVNVFNTVSGIQFPSLPEGFYTTPTLNWKVFSQSQQITDCEVAYRTTGFSWKSDYLITLNPNETLGDIGGWVTIDNYSGKKYTNAKMKLIAGQVNTVSSNNYNNNGILYKTSAFAVADSPSFSEKSFADYHLYTLSQPVTLTESSQKQIEFIPKVYGVGLRKYNLININTGGYTNENLPVSNKIHFQNTKDQGLGIPLPKGTFRVFKSDQADGSLQFIGQDNINHTPKNENITLTTGKAFDIVARLYSQDRTTLLNNNRGGYIANMNLTVTNHKETAADIEVQFTNYYGNNFVITWKNQDVALLKQTSSLYKFTRKLSKDQTYVFEWKEQYNP